MTQDVLDKKLVLKKISHDVVELAWPEFIPHFAIAYLYRHHYRLSWALSLHFNVRTMPYTRQFVISQVNLSQRTS